MPVNVIAHDTRLEGGTPRSTAGTVALEVGDSTHITDFFDQMVAISDANNGIGNLYILCHGVHVLDVDTTALQFCHELIAYTTVHHFQRLRDKVDRIIIFACHAAESTMTRSGDGDELCRHIAMNAHAEVTAATEDQAYYHAQRFVFGFLAEDGPIDFQDWEGTVVVYGRDGNVIARFFNPSVWYDADHVIHDPRTDPRPGVWYDADRRRHERY